jgi:two-component system response regulator BaeR
MPNQEILIVEDEVKIAEILKDYLTKAGYKTAALYSGETVVPHVKRNPPNLILLDVMLPGMDGMEVCREIRKFSDVPVIMVTARVEEIDRLLGLQLGADDYICKPFSPREVVARVNAVLRRAQGAQTEKTLEVGAVHLNPEMHQAFVHENELKLTPCEYTLLKTLMTHPNRVFPRNELIMIVQGYDFEGYDRTIDSHVKNLRKKIAEHIPGEEVISTVYGIGYKYVHSADEK